MFSRRHSTVLANSYEFLSHRNHINDMGIERSKAARSRAALKVEGDEAKLCVV